MMFRPHGWFFYGRLFSADLIFLPYHHSSPEKNRWVNFYWGWLAAGTSWIGQRLQILAAKVYSGIVSSGAIEIMTYFGRFKNSLDNLHLG
jgi:hypothetical protein